MQELLTMKYSDIYTPLKEVFGYDTFRPLQEDIVRTVISGNDAVVIMPTGGGKSMCFQLPALLFPGVTIVVSPLIALMKDQVDGLKANGVSAAYLNSSQSMHEQYLVHDQIRKREIDLVYTAPESLGNLGSMLSEKYVSMIAVDEAHCISSWGHDFRPSYQQLSFLKERLPNTPVMALTASADATTRQDIAEQLRISNASLFISSFDRPNIELEVRPGQKRINQIKAFLYEHVDESGIVYCLSRKTTEDIASRLSALGFNCQAYHAGLTSQERTRVQEDFINDRLKIVCATIAFGMGIDKSNVRFVIHYNMPKNIEGFYQEIGRAGRDGEPSKSLLFHSIADVIQLRKFTEGAQNEELQNAKIERMKQFAEARSCRRRILLNYFGEELSKDCGKCDVCRNPPAYVDGTILAQKVLSTVSRCKEKYSVRIVIDILRGSKNNQILSNRLDTISTYGIGKDISTNDWQHYIVELINQGYLRIAFHRYNALELTDLSPKVLFENQKVQLTLPKLIRRIADSSKERNLKASATLFDHLRKLRLSIAQKEGIPAYLVFNDATLRDMERLKPRNMTAMLQVSGVGTYKMNLYGPQFIGVIDSYFESSKPKKTKVDTVKVSYDFFLAGKTVDEIAETRGLKTSTVLNHLIKIYENGGEIDMHQFLEKHVLASVKRLKEELGSPNELKPYFESLDEEVPYEQIRVALSILNRKVQ